MASAVATPLERQFGRIAGLTELTSTSSLGNCSVVLQFDMNRNIDAASRDVQAAINAARSQLPTDLPGNPTYKKVNPADAPILIFALNSDTVTRGHAAGLDARQFLAAHDSYSYFDALGDLIRTGPTLTNVNDIRAIVIG